MYVYMVHIDASVIGDACDVHVYMCACGACGACMCLWCIYAHICLVVHVVYLCVYGASMHTYLFCGACGT